MTIVDSEISCKFPEGVGSGHTWKVYGGNHDGRVSTATTSYAPPVVSGVRSDPPGRSFFLSTHGGEYVLLTGENFGPVFEPTLFATYSRFMSECDVVEPHTAVRCITAPGIGQNHTWQVSVGGQVSRPSANATS